MRSVAGGLSRPPKEQVIKMPRSEFPANPTFPSAEALSIIELARFSAGGGSASGGHFSVPALEIFNCPRTLLSRPPKEQVSSGQDTFTSLFGMGRGGSYLGKTRANENFSAGQVGMFPFCLQYSGATKRNPGQLPLRGEEVGHNMLNHREITAGHSNENFSVWRHSSPFASL